jgi:hypothetical protein
VYQCVDRHGEEQGAARAALVFAFGAGDGVPRGKQGSWFLVAGLGKVVEERAVFFHCREETLATQTVESIFEVQLQ